MTNHDERDIDMDADILHLRSPRCRKCGERYRVGNPCACEIDPVSDAWEQYKRDHGLEECE